MHPAPKYTAVFSLALQLGCSSVIVSIGDKPGSFFTEGSTMEEVSLRLGQPAEVNELETPRDVVQLCTMDTRTNRLVQPALSSTPPYDIIAEPDVVAIKVYKYLYVGRVEGEHDVGETASLAAMTAGLSEIFAVPVAIRERATPRTHEVTVWANEKGTAIAYRWVTLDPDGTPRVDMPAKLYQEPRATMDFNAPRPVVAQAIGPALEVNGFEVMGSSEDFVYGHRPYRPEQTFSGMESIEVSLYQMDANRTRVSVVTRLQASHIEGQRHWNDDVLEALARRLEDEAR